MRHAASAGRADGRSACLPVVPCCCTPAYGCPAGYFGKVSGASTCAHVAQLLTMHCMAMLLLLHLQDEMVPFSQMQALHQAAPSQSCSWEEFPDATHMDAYDANAELYWPALRAFFADKLQDSLHSSVQQR